METDFVVRRRHDDCNQLHAIFFSSGGNAVFCLGSGACFQAGGVRVLADELVGVGKAEFRRAPPGHMGDVFHPDGAVVMYLRVLANQLPGHQGDVIGCCHVPIHVKAAAVDEGGVLHAKSFCPLVHLRHKFLLAAPDVLGHGDTCGIYA